MVLRVPFKNLILSPPAVEFSKENTALVLIDVQKLFMDDQEGLALIAAQKGIEPEFEDYYAQCKAMLLNLQRIIEKARQKGILIVYPVINVEDQTNPALSKQLQESGLPIPMGDPRVQICAAVAAQDDDLVFSRGMFSIFLHTDLEEQLRAQGIDTLILCGSLANYTVQTACREAADLGFNVVMGWDASASETLDWHLQLRTALPGGPIRVRMTAQLLEMLDGLRH